MNRFKPQVDNLDYVIDELDRIRDALAKVRCHFMTDALAVDDLVERNKALLKTVGEQAAMLATAGRPVTITLAEGIDAVLVNLPPHEAAEVERRYEAIRRFKSTQGSSEG